MAHGIDGDLPDAIARGVRAGSARSADHHPPRGSDQAGELGPERGGGTHAARDHQFRGRPPLLHLGRLHPDVDQVEYPDRPPGQVGATRGPFQQGRPRRKARRRPAGFREDPPRSPRPGGSAAAGTGPSPRRTAGSRQCAGNGRPDPRAGPNPPAGIASSASQAANAANRPICCRSRGRRAQCAALRTTDRSGERSSQAVFHVEQPDKSTRSCPDRPPGRRVFHVEHPAGPDPAGKPFNGESPRNPNLVELQCGQS